MPSRFDTMFEDFITTQQQARNVRANLDVMFTDWRPSQHAVESDDFIDFDLGQVQIPGDFGDRLVGQMAKFFLRGQKNRNQSRSFDGIVLDDRVKFCKELIGNHEVEQAI